MARHRSWPDHKAGQRFQAGLNNSERDARKIKPPHLKCDGFRLPFGIDIFPWPVERQFPATTTDHTPMKRTRNPFPMAPLHAVLRPHDEQVHKLQENF
jgi:hypothetical protein